MNQPRRTLENAGMKSYKANEAAGKTKHSFYNLGEKSFETMIERIKNNKKMTAAEKKTALAMIKEERKYRKEHLKDNIIYSNGKITKLDLKKDYGKPISDKIRKHKAKIGTHNMFPIREIAMTAFAPADASMELKQKISKRMIELQVKYGKSKGVNVAICVAHLNEDAARNGKLHTHCYIENGTDKKGGGKLGYLDKKKLYKFHQDMENNVFKQLAKEFPECINYISNAEKKEQGLKSVDENIGNKKFDAVVKEAKARTAAANTPASSSGVSVEEYNALAKKYNSKVDEVKELKIQLATANEKLENQNQDIDLNEEIEEGEPDYRYLGQAINGSKMYVFLDEHKKRKVAYTSLVDDNQIVSVEDYKPVNLGYILQYRSNEYDKLKARNDKAKALFAELEGSYTPPTQEQKKQMSR